MYKLDLKPITHNLKPATGFTLIEALIYIALFSIVIGGGIGTAFYIAQGTQNVHQFILRESEANFVLRKIDWALNQASSVNVPGGEDSVLEVVIGGDTLEFEKTGGVVFFDGTNLTGSGVTVNSLKFKQTPASASVPEKLEVVMSINGKNFNKTVYIR